VFNTLVANELKGTKGANKFLEKKLAISLNELGIAYMMNKAWEDAANCFLEAVRIMESVDVSATELKSLPLANLGLACWLMGDHLKEADDVLISALADREVKYGPNDRESFM